MLLTNTGLDVEVKYNGWVRYFLPFTANSLCQADVKYFPFDKQTCSLMFGSWAHTTASTSFQSTKSELYLGDFYDNQEWILTEGKKVLKASKNSFKFMTSETQNQLT